MANNTAIAIVYVTGVFIILFVRSILRGYKNESLDEFTATVEFLAAFFWPITIWFMTLMGIYYSIILIGGRLGAYLRRKR